MRSAILHRAGVALLILLAAALHAATYQGEEFTFRQPDGRPIPVRIWGDEFAVDVETRDGLAITRDQDGWWCYAVPALPAGIQASAVRVGQDPAALGVQPHLRQSKAQRAASHAIQRQRLGRDEHGRLDTDWYRARRAAPAAGRAAGMAFAPPDTTTVGVRYGLTIPIQFPDRPADVAITRSQIDAFCNQVGYTDASGNNGSIRDYYTDNSHGRLDYTNYVTDYRVASLNRDFYADPAAENVHVLVEEMLNQLDDEGFDFSLCDADGDKVVDALNLFYAGEIVNDWAEGLWPHMSPIYWIAGTGYWESKYGYQVMAYQITDIGTELSIGTFCHENGHMLCDFPDLYDYDYDSIGGAGIFCLMSAGSDGGGGKNPTRVCGYLALKAGWLDPVDLVATDSGNLNITAESQDIFRYVKPGTPTEYFLFENRSKTSGAKRDAALPCSGIAIWHIDELGDRDDQRYADNTTHSNYECALVQADNLRHFENDTNQGDTRDLWFQGNAASGYTGVFEDSDGTDAQANDARWWDGSVSGLVLSSFSVPSATMSVILGEAQLGFVASAYSVQEGDSGTTQATVTLRRVGRTKVAASVDWAVSEGTATLAGLDFTTASGTVSWAAGEIDKSFRVPVRGDTMSESDETINMSLSNPQGPHVTLGDLTTAVLTITNDDGDPPLAGSLEFVSYTATAVEGALGAVNLANVAVRRRGGSTGVVTVNWQTSDGTATAGTDYDAASGTLTWLNGDTSNKYIAVSVRGDIDPESDETLTLTLSGATGGAVAPTPNQMTITIQDDDPSVSFHQSSVTWIEPATGNSYALAVVERSGSPREAISVDYAFTGGTADQSVDYIGVPGTLSWAAGETATRSVTIQMLSDGIREQTETVEITLSNPINAVITGSSVSTINIRDSVSAKSDTGSDTGNSVGGCGAGATGLLLGFGCLTLAMRRRRR